MLSCNSRPLFPKEMFLWVHFYFCVEDFALSFYNQLGFFFDKPYITFKRELGLWSVFIQMLLDLSGIHSAE